LEFESFPDEYNRMLAGGWGKSFRLAGFTYLIS